ncbi:NUDIX hydrolase [Mobilicoccus pelagius]|uniref:NUDIX hydrolase n=1 Tax=Mobilicoccus pelagius TaxID=746032 RepID=UPI00058F0556|nr:NUDIX hydrolase [Mobilicoccus pelagius]
MTSPLRADITATLTSWSAPDADQDALRHAYLAFLAARPDAPSRTCAPGHVTASVVVLSADRTRTLLTLHPRVGRWLQLGGHVEEGDASLADAARREAREEGGFDVDLDPIPVDLHCHPIVCKGYTEPTRHLDVRYVALAPEGALEARSEESTDLRWFDVDALPDLPAEVENLVRRAVERASDVTGR